MEIRVLTLPMLLMVAVGESSLLFKLQKVHNHVKIDELDIVLEIMKHGGWRDVIYISNTDFRNSDIFKQGTLSCASSSELLQEIIRQTRPIDDYINVIVDCNDLEMTENIVSTLLKSSDEWRLNLMSTNWRIELIVNFREGDNFVWPQLHRNSSVVFELFGCLVCHPYVQITSLLNITNLRDLRKRSPLLPADFTQFHGRELIVKYISYLPFTVETLGVMTGIDAEIVKILAEKFNFSIAYSKSVGYGAMDENGIWTGMVADIMNGDGQIAIGGMTAAYLREQVIDFLYPHHEESSIFVFQTTLQRTQYFMLPLRPTVWAFLLTTVVVVALFHFKAYLVLNDFKETRLFRLDCLWPFFSIFLNNIGVLVLQGCSEYRSVSSKLVHITFVFTGLVIVLTYAGNLTASLVKPRARKPFSSVQELINNEDYNVFIRKDSFNMLMLQTSNAPVHQNLWTKIQSQPDFTISPSASSKVFPYVLNSSSVFFNDKTVLNKYRFIGEGAERCSTGRLKDEWFPSTLAIAVQENVPYKRHFDKVIVEIMQYGLKETWWNSLYPKETCDMNEMLNQHSVELQDSVFVWIIFAVLLTISFAVLIGELSLVKYKRGKIHVDFEY